MHMRGTCKSIFILLVILAPFSVKLKAQDFQTAGDYLAYINKANEKVTVTYLTYMSAVSHGKSARKVEKRRAEVVNTIYETRFNIQSMPPWKGDRTYRDTTVAYFKLLYNIFNEDYAKIVNMEEIAEQSYDAMEAYMLAQEKAHERLDLASKRQSEVQKQFAAKNNINLIDDESELERKSKQAGEIMKHYNDVYLVFFKPYKQEGYLIEASAKKNVISVEQNKNSLQKFAEDGLEKLKGMKGYNNDPSLIEACKQVMEFFKSEASKAQAITDFVLKEENFNKMKKTFESTPASKRTQQDVDKFNKGVNEFNASINDINTLNKQLNKEREAAINTWNKTVNKYMDDYMPVQRK